MCSSCVGQALHETTLKNECGNAVVAQLPVARLRKQEVGDPSKRISPQNRTPTASPTLTSDPDPHWVFCVCVIVFWVI